MKTTLKRSREQLINEWSQKYGIDISKGLRVTIKEYNEGGFAPEKYSYKISFNSYGARQKYNYWPETVGYQGA